MAFVDLDDINRLLLHPSESLAVELKSWLDPSSQLGEAKIARALIALRNNNGGVLVFGFDDETREPVAEKRPPDVNATFHPDIIQGIIKAHCLPPFEVAVYIGERDGASFPAIAVPGDIRTPAIARQQVKEGKKTLLRQHAVYFRSIQNGVVESCEPRSPADWEALIARCFDNREAEIGRFLRRHAPALIEEMRQGNEKVVSPTSPNVPFSDSPEGEPSEPPSSTAPVKDLDEITESGRTAFASRAQYLSQRGSPKISDRPAWREVAVICEGPLRQISIAHLLDELLPHHPRLTGWPIWIDSRGNSREEARPYVHQGGWEALVTMKQSHFVQPMIDFWRLNPEGRFYHRRTLEDDVMEKLGDSRGKVLDFLLPIWRVAEALATAQAFSQALATEPEQASMRVQFCWTGLSGRELTCWTEPARDIWTAVPAYENRVISEVKIPLTTPTMALVPYLSRALKPLFDAFGFSPSAGIFEDVAGKVLTRH